MPANQNAYNLQEADMCVNQSNHRSDKNIHSKSDKYDMCAKNVKSDHEQLIKSKVHEISVYHQQANKTDTNLCASNWQSNDQVCENKSNVYYPNQVCENNPNQCTYSLSVNKNCFKLKYGRPHSTQKCRYWCVE